MRVSIPHERQRVEECPGAGARLHAFGREVTAEGARTRNAMEEAEHMCMSMRGVEKPGSKTITTQFTGSFRESLDEQVRFMTMVRGG